MIQNSKGEVETIEIKLLLEAIFSYYGFDFRDYAKSSLKRRIIKQIQQEQLSSISGLFSNDKAFSATSFGLNQPRSSGTISLPIFLLGRAKNRVRRSIILPEIIFK